MTGSIRWIPRPYFLEPGSDEASLRAYRLLADVMARSGRGALGRFVMRTKEYLAIVRERDGALSLETLRFADEIRPTDEIERGGGQPPTEAELDTAVSVIEAMTVEWDPARYSDRYRERLADVIDRKRRGKPIAAAKPGGRPAPAPDLLTTLSATLEQLQAQKSGERATGKAPARPATRGAGKAPAKRTSERQAPRQR